MELENGGKERSRQEQSLLLGGVKQPSRSSSRVKKRNKAELYGVEVTHERRRIGGPERALAGNNGKLTMVTEKRRRPSSSRRTTMKAMIPR
ncbi:hypothetical protein AALP_AA8G144300 [Arabis alpina]|uniref:Uncharacterized protein n=1 Tax=Arabis alpina TaxID=50452 RepID=A0A087G718_ARAAL|nr:hypothetical protein AALP_AA8G144300 [Arabis alpina]